MNLLKYRDVMKSKPSPPQNPLAQNQGRWYYEVTATLISEEARTEYIDWLFSGHVSAVCRWAEEAEVVALNADTSGSDHPWRVKSVYWFTDQNAFDVYEREGAPTLRTEGIALSHELGGIKFERDMGWSWTVSHREPLS